MAQSIGMARPELVQVADTVARDKNIDREEVFIAMEQAIQKAGRSKYGHEKDIRAAIDRKNGEIRLARYVTVVDTVEDENTQITVAGAQKKNPGIKAGEEIFVNYTKEYWDCIRYNIKNKLYKTKK